MKQKLGKKEKKAKGAHFYSNPMSMNLDDEVGSNEKRMKRAARFRETGMEMIQGINLGMIRGTEKEKKAGEKGRWRGVTGDILERGKRRVDGINILLILKFPLLMPVSLKENTVGISKFNLHNFDLIKQIFNQYQV